MKQILQSLSERRDLDRATMEKTFDRIMAGELTPAQIAAFIMALRMKGESVEELTGAAASMRRHAVLIDTGGVPVVDTCGTGGDGHHTLNVSTAVSLVVAA